MCAPVCRQTSVAESLGLVCVVSDCRQRQFSHAIPRQRLALFLAHPDSQQRPPPTPRSCAATSLLLLLHRCIYESFNYDHLGRVPARIDIMYSTVHTNIEINDFEKEALQFFGTNR